MRASLDSRYCVAFYIILNNSQKYQRFQISAAFCGPVFMFSNFTSGGGFYSLCLTVPGVYVVLLYSFTIQLKWAAGSPTFFILFGWLSAGRIFSSLVYGNRVLKSQSLGDSCKQLNCKMTSTGAWHIAMLFCVCKHSH